MKTDIIIICGPTGIGKTATTISLAKAFNGEIINADSMQLYKYMDIGTAKPTSEERAEVAHHIVDMIPPDEPFDAAKFAATADELILKFNKKGITPFIAGGTGLYIKSLVDGLFRANPANPEIINRLTGEAETKGIGTLYERLLSCDPESAAKIHPNDSFRIIRALETFETTGKPISQHHNQHNFADKRYRALKIGLSMERETLYERINMRVDLMLEEGLLDEVKTLIKMGFAPSLKPMKSLGYRHMVEYIQGETDWEEAVRTLKRDTRRYAKRQLTWFRSDHEIEWFPPDNISEIEQRIKNFLQGQIN